MEIHILNIAGDTSIQYHKEKKCRKLVLKTEYVCDKEYCKNRTTQENINDALYNNFASSFFLHPAVWPYHCM